MFQAHELGSADLEIFPTIRHDIIKKKKKSNYIYMHGVFEQQFFIYTSLAED